MIELFFFLIGIAGFVVFVMIVGVAIEKIGRNMDRWLNL